MEFICIDTVYRLPDKSFSGKKSRNNRIINYSNHSARVDETAAGTLNTTRLPYNIIPVHLVQMWAHYILYIYAHRHKTDISSCARDHDWRDILCFFKSLALLSSWNIIPLPLLIIARFHYIAYLTAVCSYILSQHNRLHTRVYIW